MLRDCLTQYFDHTTRKSLTFWRNILAQKFFFLEMPCSDADNIFMWGKLEPTNLLGMYFDAAVVFVMKSSLLFRLAVAILWPEKIADVIYGWSLRLFF